MFPHAFRKDNLFVAQGIHWTGHATWTILKRHEFLHGDIFRNIANMILSMPLSASVVGIVILHSTHSWPKIALNYSWFILPGQISMCSMVYLIEQWIYATVTALVRKPMYCHSCLPDCIRTGLGFSQVVFSSQCDLCLKVVLSHPCTVLWPFLKHSPVLIFLAPLKLRIRILAELKYHLQVICRNPGNLCFWSLTLA